MIIKCKRNQNEEELSNVKKKKIQHTKLFHRLGNPVLFHTSSVAQYSRTDKKKPKYETNVSRQYHVHLKKDESLKFIFNPGL